VTGPRSADRPAAQWLAVVVAALVLLLIPGRTHGATPGAGSPGSDPAPIASPAAVIGSGDARSDGEGPGFVGSPVAIALGVVVLGATTAIGTIVLLRVNGARRRR
jgi:hypothetical protein